MFNSPTSSNKTLYDSHVISITCLFCPPSPVSRDPFCFLLPWGGESNNHGICDHEKNGLRNDLCWDERFSSGEWWQLET